MRRRAVARAFSSAARRAVCSAGVMLGVIIPARMDPAMADLILNAQDGQTSIGVDRCGGGRIASMAGKEMTR